MSFETAKQKKRILNYFHSLGDETRTTRYKPPKNIKDIKSCVEKASTDPQIRWILQNIPKKKKITILDYGCGWGLFICALFNKKGIKCIRYIGIDTDEHALQKAKWLFDKSHLKRKCNSIFTNQLEDLGTEKIQSGIDCIILNNVIHHIHPRDLGYSILNLLQLSKKNGLLLIADQGLLYRTEFGRVTWFPEELDYIFKDVKTLFAVNKSVFSKSTHTPLLRYKIVKVKNRLPSLTTLNNRIRKILRTRIPLLEDMISRSGRYKEKWQYARLLDLKHFTHTALSHWDDSGKVVEWQINKMNVPTIKRETLEKRILNNIKRKNIILVHGPIGTGKTSVIGGTIKTQKYFQNKNIIACRATLTTSIANIIEQVNDYATLYKWEDVTKTCIEIFKQGISRNTNKLKDSLLNHPLILIIDDAHLCSDECLDILFKIFLGQNNCKLILVGTTKPSYFQKWRTNFYSVYVPGFTILQVKQWLSDQNKSSSITWMHAKEYWKSSQEGNPKILQLRSLFYREDKKVRLGFSPKTTINQLSNNIKDILLCLISLQDDNDQSQLFEVLPEVSEQQLNELANRYLVEKAGNSWKVHDSSRFFLLQFEKLNNRVKYFHEKIARNIVSSINITDLRDKRLQVELREKCVSAFLHLVSSEHFAVATNILEAISYDIYMAGQYTRFMELIRKITQNSSLKQKLIRDPYYFFFFLRSVRILKRWERLNEAKDALEVLLKYHSGREHLAAIKELAEIHRLDGNAKKSVELFKLAIKLDKKFARDKIDKAITLKQLGISYAEDKNYKEAIVMVQNSLSMRDSADDYGKASCNRYLGYIMLLKIKGKSNIFSNIKEIKKYFEKCFDYSETGCKAFERLRDVEGEVGCLKIYFEARLLKYKLFKSPNDKYLAQECWKKIGKHKDVISLKDQQELNFLYKKFLE